MNISDVEKKPVENVVSLKAVSTVAGEKTRVHEGVTFKLVVNMHKSDKNQLLLTYEEKIEEKPKTTNPMEMIKLQMRLQFEGPCILARHPVKLTRWDRLLGRTLMDKTRSELKKFDAKLDKMEQDLKHARSIEQALAE